VVFGEEAGRRRESKAKNKKRTKKKRSVEERKKKRAAACPNPFPPTSSPHLGHLKAHALAQPARPGPPALWTRLLVLARGAPALAAGSAVCIGRLFVFAIVEAAALLLRGLALAVVDRHS